MAGGQRRPAVRRHRDEPVAGERGDGLLVGWVGPGGDGAKGERAALAEGAREGALAAERLVATAPRGAECRERAVATTGVTPEARQRSAPRSKSAWAHDASKLSPVRSWIRRTFVSTGSTFRPNAKFPTAAAV